MKLSSKKIQILEVAERLFAEKGFDGASVRQIAKEADVNVAMISYYFGSKENLLTTLFTFRNSDFKMKLETVLSKNIGFLEKIDEIVALIIKRIHKNRRIYKIIHFEFSNKSREIDFEMYILQKKENYKLVETFIHAGQKAGVFSKEVRIPLITSTILGTYFNLYYNKKLFQQIHQIQENNFEDFIHSDLTQHLQTTIKALLTYKSNEDY